MNKLNKSKVAFVESFVTLQALKNNPVELENTYYEIIDAKRDVLKIDDAQLLHELVNSSIEKKQ